MLPSRYFGDKTTRSTGQEQPFPEQTGTATETGGPLLLVGLSSIFLILGILMFIHGPTSASAGANTINNGQVLGVVFMAIGALSVALVIITARRKSL
jgi:ABC-type Co2+ transport system permease subunit